MNILSLNPRRLLLVGVAIAALVAGTLALLSSLGAQPSRAAVNDNQITCKGFIQPTTAAQDPDDPDLYHAQYRIRCDQAITGYSLFVSAQQVQAIETEAFPEFADGSPVPTDSFSCNGDLPGNGVNCVGKYTNLAGIITGTFAIEKPLCTPARIEPILTVAKASVSSSGAAVLAISGPFSLGQSAGCKGKKNKPRTMPLMPRPSLDDVPEIGDPGYTGPNQ